jgi:hypothetical protein
MAPGNVEGKEEYELSKYFLGNFICSQTVLDVVGGHWFLVYKVIKFLRSHLYTWETLYLHYMQSNEMHFDIVYSSAHKGTNHGLKSHNCAVKPTINLDSFANTINIQASIKVQECKEMIFQDAMQTHKKWSDLPTSKHTMTSVGEGILQRMMSKINHYQAKLVSRQMETSTFQVCYTKTRTEDLAFKELPGTSVGLVMIQTKRRMTVWGIMFSFHPYHFFHVFAVLLLIKPVPCSVPASILKG